MFFITVKIIMDFLAETSRVLKTLEVSAAANSIKRIANYAKMKIKNKGGLTLQGF